MTELFKCVLRTERQNPVTVHEADGSVIVTLKPRRIVTDPMDGTKKEIPGAEFTLETDDPYATFARYSEVTFLHEAPWAKVIVRPGWVEPKRRWPTEFILIQGHTDPEYRTTSKGPVCLHHGVPVVVDMDPNDPLARYDRVECGVGHIERYPSVAVDGYVAKRRRLEDVKHLRPQADLERIAEVSEHD